MSKEQRSGLDKGTFLRPSLRTEVEVSVSDNLGTFVGFW